MAERPLTDTEIEDRTEEWQEAKPGDQAFLRELHEHLGMSWDEYVARFGPVAVRQAAAEDRAAGEARHG